MQWKLLYLFFLSGEKLWSRKWLGFCFVLVQATNYVLSHQEEDSAGEIETKLIKVSFASP